MVAAAIIQEPSFPPLSNKSLIGLIQVLANNILIPTDYPRKKVLNHLRRKLALLHPLRCCAASS